MNYLIKTPDDVLQVMEQIEKQKDIKSRGNNLMELEYVVNDARRKILETKEKIDWKLWFLGTGFIVFNILREDHKFNKLDFAKFLLGKHKLYGLKPLLVWEELGILIRLQSKVDRLINITNNVLRVDLGNEAVEDTLKDILGYCVLGHLLPCHLNNIQSKEEG